MKKIIAFFLVCLLGSNVYAATNQPNNIGNVKASKLAVGIQTLAQLNALTPDTTGQIIACSDCVRSAVCISSGAASGNVGAWVILVTTGAFQGAGWVGFPHCQ